MRSPDPGDDSDNIEGSIDASQCAAFYPPTPQAAWVLSVVDTAAADTGTIDLFELIGPGGEVLVVEGPEPIPDNDPEGAFLALFG